MSSTPSTHDNRVSPNDEIDAGSLGAIAPGGDAVLHGLPDRTSTNVTTDTAVPTGTAVPTDTAVTTDAAATTDAAVTTDKATTAGTAITSIPGVHSRSVQPTKPLSSLDGEMRQIQAVESSILASPGKDTIGWFRNNLSKLKRNADTVSYYQGDTMPQIPFAFTPHRQTADEATTTIPRVEPRVITDLPNEILHKIFSYLSGGNKWRDVNKTMWDFSSTSKVDIKNVRLSCKQLSIIASTHFMDHVTVVLSHSSLENFERISNHPDIRYGVQAVRISLAQYDDAITSLEDFARYHVDNLALPYEESQETRAKAASIAQAWDKYLRIRDAHNDIFLLNFDHEEIDHIQALVQGYYAYQHRLQEQKNLVQASGTAGFTVRLSNAMARLPLGNHLEVTDWDTIHWGPRSRYPLRCLDISDQQSLVSSLSQWRNPFDMVGGTKYLYLVPGVTCIGIRRSAERGIASLNIQFSLPIHIYAQLSLLNLQEDNLRLSLRNLRSFRFESWDQSPPNPELDPQGYRAFARFLDACLDSERLECLVVDPNLAFYSEESLIRLRSWPKLKYAVLKRLPASESDLEGLTAPIASWRRGCLIMNDVRLCGGTWADALEMLRNRCIRVSLGGFQTGAECDTRPDGGIGVFCRNRGLPSFAEYYVRGEDMPNPILNAPSKEVQNALFSLVSSHQDGLETVDQDF